MKTIKTNELTLNNKVKTMIGKPVSKKHVAGIGYVYYFDGGFAHRSGSGFEAQIIITYK